MARKKVQKAAQSVPVLGGFFLHSRVDTGKNPPLAEKGIRIRVSVSVSELEIYSKKQSLRRQVYRSRSKQKF
jgi:hypothetical protein